MKTIRTLLVGLASISLLAQAGEAKPQLKSKQGGSNDEYETVVYTETTEMKYLDCTNPGGKQCVWPVGVSEGRIIPSGEELIGLVTIHGSMALVENGVKYTVTWSAAGDINNSSIYETSESVSHLQ
jgi:hypothetical protein